MPGKRSRSTNRSLRPQSRVIRGRQMSGRTGVPMMDSTNNSIRVRHREYIRDINSTVAFSNVNQFPINPGLASTFPFLAGIANNYQSYKLHGCAFFFKSTSCDALNSTNSALGYIVGATDYNSLDIPYVDKQTMESTTYAKSCKPSESCLFPIQCDPTKTFSPQLYVRSGPPATGGDLRLYDHALFELATGGSQAAFVAGELWVSYDVQFYEPQITIPRGLQIPSAHWRIGAPTDAAIFGSASASFFNNIGAVLNGTNITMPANVRGSWLLNCTWSQPGGASAGAVIGTMTFTNATGRLLYTNGTVAQVTNGGTVENQLYVAIFQVTDPSLPVIITQGVSVLISPLTGGDVFLTQLNGGIA